MLLMHTAGESHGKAIVALIEGLPAGYELDLSYIAEELRRRKVAPGRGKRQEIEEDDFEIVSGIIKNRTIGSPLTILIWNTEYEKWKYYFEGDKTDDTFERYTPRPGHADYAGAVKYGFESVRPVLERASARSTAAIVAAGAIFKKILEKYFSIIIGSYLLSIDGKTIQNPAKITPVEILNARNNPYHTIDSEENKKIDEILKRLEDEGTTCGGSIQVVAFSVPPGLGSYANTFSRMDARIAAGIMGIPSVKAVEIGAGIKISKLYGRTALDEFEIKDGIPVRTSNYSGGIEGGVTNGEPLYFNVYFKPVPTQRIPLKSINLKTGEISQAFYERSDIFVARAIGVISESMLAYILLQAIFEKFGGDAAPDIEKAYINYLSRIKWKPHQELQL